MSVPVPDLDRTDLLVIFGANPMASNGSLCTAPDFPGRLARLRDRGGRFVVVDPRRTRTAEEADDWLAIRPGTDALALMAIVNVLFADGLADPGTHVGEHVAGVDELRAASAPFTPEAVAGATGLDAGVLRRLARDLASAPSAAVYGRIGTTTTEFGSVASWLVDAVNVLTGNLDRPGGAMFTRPAAGGPTTRGEPGRGSGFRPGRRRTRVRGLADVMGELPVATLAEEITTDGDGQLRALVTVAGNPVLSTPNSDALDAALAELDFMVSVDIYLNETTRHADVILPAPSPLQHSHYDVLLLQFAVRNVANYSPPVLPLDPDQPDEWEIVAKLALIAQGAGAAADAAVVDELAVASVVRAAVADPSSPAHEMDADQALAELAASGRRGPDRLLDAMLRTGPYGDGFGSRPGGLTLDELLDHPHGLDFGPLEPRLPEMLRTPSGKVELAPPELIADVERLRVRLERPADDGMLLVGRRHLRSNNSWMHNLEVLVKGRARCTLQVHPDDADRLGLRAGASATVSSRVGTVVAPVEVTDGIRPGVVSLPHGWGHGLAGTRQRVAGERRGVNANVLTDHEALDPLSGTSVLNGIPVSVAPVNGD
jgi:anaerobic selenocysteine-containing dehydrogenase